MMFLQIPDWNPLWGLAIAFACVLALLALMTLIANRLRVIQRTQGNAILVATDAAAGAQVAAAAAAEAVAEVRQEAMEAANHAQVAATAAAEAAAEVRREVTGREATLAEIKHLVNSSATEMKQRIEQLTAQLQRAGLIPEAPPKEPS